MLPTLATTVLINTALDGNWNAVAIPACRAWSLKARNASNALKLSDSSGGTNYITIPGGSSYDSPICDFAAQTLYVQGTNGDVAELITFK